MSRNDREWLMTRFCLHCITIVLCGMGAWWSAAEGGWGKCIFFVVFVVLNALGGVAAWAKLEDERP